VETSYRFSHQQQKKHKICGNPRNHTPRNQQIQTKQKETTEHIQRQNNNPRKTTPPGYGENNRDQIYGTSKKKATNLSRHHQKAKNKLREKYQHHGKINTLNKIWSSRKYESEAKELIDAAKQNNMKPIWNYQRKLRSNPQSNQKHTPLRKDDGTYTQNTEQTMEQWAKWIKKQFQISPEQETPEIDHITEEDWGKIEQITKPQAPPEIHTPGQTKNINFPDISKDLQHIRKQARLTQAIKKHPQIKEWLIEDYTEDEINKTIQQLKNNKSHGQDGIPGETYKALKPWIAKPIMQILNKIKNRDKLPPEWTQGTMVHIYKKGDAHECKNYRPICLTQIIYKIWSKLITGKLIQIIHLLTDQTQYGYKPGLSTLDTILKIEQYIQNGTKGEQILLMDLSKAFDTINRTQLWTTLYKKGIPLETITHIRKGHQNTMLRAKHQGKYGEASENNVGVSQGSAISALMFIIYLDDMMEDYEAINHKEKLISRQQIIRDPDTETKQLAQRLGKLQENNTPENTSLSPQKCSRRKQQTLREENNTPREIKKSQDKNQTAKNKSG